MEELSGYKTYRNINIIFEYGIQKISIVAQPYRTLGDIKLKALLRIFGAPSNLHCYYLNRDYSQKENEQIGNLFPRREIVTIRLMLPSKNNLITSKLRINTEIFPSIDDYNSKKFNFHNPSRSKVDMLHLKDKNNNNKNINNTDFLYEDEEKIKNRIFQSIDISKNYSVNTKNKYYLCNNCNKRIINFYCRNCQEFICDKCRYKLKHKKHFNIKIDPNNLEENVKLYIGIVQTDIEQKVHANEEYYKNFYEKQTLISHEEYQNDILKKMEIITKVYNNIMEKLQSSLLNPERDSLDLVLNEYNLNSQIINGELNTLINEIDNKFINEKKKMNFEDFRNYYNKINLKEKEWDSLIGSIMIFKVYNDINEKVNRMYEKIQKSLNEIISVDTPFNLDKKEIEFLDSIGNDLEQGKSDNEDSKNDFNSSINEENKELNSKDENNKDNNNKKINNEDAISESTPIHKSAISVVSETSPEKKKSKKNNKRLSIGNIPSLNINKPNS
jgi:hypothetical protein